MSPETSAAALQTLVERFVKAFADFVNEVNKAVQEAVMNPELSSTPGLLMWQTDALPLLEQQNAAIQNGLALFQIGESATILNLADRARGLAKQLDGLPLDFAGPQYAAGLDRLETAVVVAAYLLCKAVRNP